MWRADQSITGSAVSGQSPECGVRLTVCYIVYCVVQMWGYGEMCSDVLGFLKCRVSNKLYDINENRR